MIIPSKIQEIEARQIHRPTTTTEYDDIEYLLNQLAREQATALRLGHMVTDYANAFAELQEQFMTLGGSQ